MKDLMGNYNFSDTDWNYNSNLSQSEEDGNTNEFVVEPIPHPNMQLSYSVLLGIAIYLTVVGLVSTIGNILLIMVVTRWRVMRNNAHMLLLLNMAICDMAISITGYPYTTVSGYIGGWIFGDLMCQLYAFLCFTFSQVSMNTLVAVSVFRYISICKPHLKHLLTSDASKSAIFGTWLYALFWTVPPLLGWSSYDFEPTHISCSIDWNNRSISAISYVIGTIIFCYLTHITTMSWCYYKIFEKILELKNSHSHLNKDFRVMVTLGRLHPFFFVLLETLYVGEESVDSPLQRHYDLRCESIMVFTFITENLSPLEIHVLRMNIIMVLTFTTMWTPYAVTSLISIFYSQLSPVWYIFPTLFAKTASMMNPIVYGLTNKFLRKEFLSVVRRTFGLTTAMEELQFNRKKNQEGLYDKEGIYTGKRLIGGGLCICDACLESTKQMNLVMRQQREREIRSRNASPIPIMTAPYNLQTLPSIQADSMSNISTSSSPEPLLNRKVRFSRNFFSTTKLFERSDKAEKQPKKVPSKSYSIPYSLSKNQIGKNMTLTRDDIVSECAETQEIHKETEVNIVITNECRSFKVSSV